MRITCKQKDLKYALDIVSLAVNTSSTLPVLNNILLKAAEGKLFFSATNLEIAINYAVAGDVKNEGSITVPAKLLTNYISLLTDDQVEMKVEGGMTLHIASASSQTKIKGISPDEFPLIPKVEKETSFTIPAKDFSEAIDRTVFSAAVGGSRPILAGVYMQSDKDVLTMVATDSFRLAEKKLKLSKKVEGQIECVIPVRTMLELGRILNSCPAGAALDVCIAKNQILFSANGIELLSRLIEGKFPDYEKIIPKATRTKFQVASDQLTQATKRVSLFARENNNSIKLTATNNGKLQIATDETSVGEEKAEVEITMEGENNKIAINSQYLLDVLGHLKENVSIEMSEKLTPVVVRSAKKDDYLYIIMPLKV
ncbi:DNA polymerase III subunit beta [Candidatus Peregrinibacteria bacterium CG_4_9_14_0_2_um_filter_53_11]|nr:MAG: DNA polymerase III subunit beta [Candidatus Peregrinibacteria bacterium CG_4_9_14_0_2_um_filter_53_11]